MCYRAFASQVVNSFPTRRSSDLSRRGRTERHRFRQGREEAKKPGGPVASVCTIEPRAELIESTGEPCLHGGDRRSEEHTSELQSLRHLVCRLLLEKKTITIKLYM